MGTQAKVVKECIGLSNRSAWRKEKMDERAGRGKAGMVVRRSTRLGGTRRDNKVLQREKRKINC